MRPPSLQVQKNECKSSDIIVNEKHIGTRKYSQLTRTIPVAEIVIVSFSASLLNFFSIVAVHCYPASMFHRTGGCSSVLAEEFTVCRDKRGKGSTKWQKGKINLAVPSDLRGLLPASSDPKQSTDAHTRIRTAGLSLLPCSWLCLASCPHTVGRYSLFLGLQEGGR